MSPKCRNAGLGSVDRVNQNRTLVTIDRYGIVVSKDKFRGPRHSMISKLLDDGINLGPQTNQLWAKPEDMENIRDTMSTSPACSRDIKNELMKHLRHPIPKR